MLRAGRRNLLLPKRNYIGCGSEQAKVSFKRDGSHGCTDGAIGSQVNTPHNSSKPQPRNTPHYLARSFAENTRRASARVVRFGTARRQTWEKGEGEGVQRRQWYSIRSKEKGHGQ